MIKLIITDMDGTLLNDKNEIADEFWSVERELNNRGVIFAVASGRQYHNLRKRFEPLKDEMLFIAENGTYVVYKNSEIYLNTIAKEEVCNLVKIARQIPDCCIVLCGKNSAYIESKEDRFIDEVEKYYERLGKVDDLTKVEDDFLKIAICDFRGSEKNSYTFFKGEEERYQVVVSGKSWLDIMKLDANKGKAVEMVQKKFGITYDETMIFGDYLNDLEMMREGRYSFAMENAHPLLKEESNFIAKSNNENGVVEAIKEYVLK